MDTNNTEFASTAEDDGVLSSADTLDSDDLLADPLDTGIIAPDRWSPGQGYGTTAAEERAGESFDQYLKQEEPDILPDVSGTWTDSEWTDSEPEPRSGRLVAPDEGAHEDVEPRAVAREVGIDGGAASAEEAAMHITRFPR